MKALKITFFLGAIVSILLGSPSFGINTQMLQDRNHIETWRTQNAGSSNFNQIIIPTSSTGVYSCTVDWGDGSTNYFTSAADPNWKHTYSVSGDYTVKINGKFTGMVFNNTGDKLKILKVSKWGPDFRIGTTQGNYFSGCSNLNIFANDVLNTQGTTQLFGAFNSCSSITDIPNLASWDVQLILRFDSMFVSCSSLNPDTTGWNVRSGTNFGALFQGTIFNRSISNLNTTSATNMGYMFAFNTAFNQPVSTLTTNLVTNFQNMFNGASAFNQDVSTWSIASLTNATNMMLNSGFNITNYNKLLDSATGWPSQTTINSGVTFSAGSAHYSGTNAIAGRAVLTGTKTWTITDGGTP